MAVYQNSQVLSTHRRASLAVARLSAEVVMEYPEPRATDRCHVVSLKRSRFNPPQYHCYLRLGLYDKDSLNLVQAQGLVTVPAQRGIQHQGR